MTVSEFLSGSRRRAVAMSVAILLCALSAASMQARSAAAQTPAQPADPLKLNLDVPTLIIYQIKPDRAADFQALWDGIRAGLGKSAKADVKAFADTLQPFRAQLDPAAQTAVFVFKLETPSKTISYNPIQLLYYADPEAIKRDEADTLYKKWDGASLGVQIWPLIKAGG
jgi:hypothetical protein